MLRRLLSPDLLLGLLAVLPLTAQAPTAEKFEVASIKPVPADRGCGPAGCFKITPWGSAELTASSISLLNLITLAFDINEIQVSGIDKLASQRFDITAKPASGSLSYERAKPMLQALLSERFKLVTHRETKDVPAYALVIAKGGPKLKPSDPAKPGTALILKGRLIHPQATLDLIASLLARPLGRPVVNRTDIQGTFNLDLRFAPDGSTDTSLPSLMTAIQEQLGLKLDSAKVPVEMLVIDHCERLPVEN